MKFENYPLHDSPRGWFGRALYFEMEKNPDIILVSVDLGFGLWDRHKEDFPNQFVNTGASEQAALGLAVGLALSGKIPVVYSITSFLLYRGFEWVRNYIDHESVPVILAGSGLDDDYAHDGITHQTFDAKNVLREFANIRKYFPSQKEDIPYCLTNILAQHQPCYICLRR